MAVIIPGIALHGLCFGCWIFVAFMIVDEETTGDVRASAQSLFNLVIIGVGIILGSKIAGWVKDWADASVDTVIKAVMGFLLLLFPTLYGWAAVDLGGDTTLSQSVAVTVFEFGAGLLAVLLGLRLWIHRPWTREEYGFLKAWPLYAVAGLSADTP